METIYDATARVEKSLGLLRQLTATLKRRLPGDAEAHMDDTDEHLEALSAKLEAARIVLDAQCARIDAN
jgi:hypothetical protein